MIWMPKSVGNMNEILLEERLAFYHAIRKNTPFLKI